MKRIKGGDIGVGAGYSGHSTTSMSIKPSLDTRHSVDRPLSSHKARNLWGFCFFSIELSSEMFPKSYQRNHKHLYLFVYTTERRSVLSIILLESCSRHLRTLVLKWNEAINIKSKHVVGPLLLSGHLQMLCYVNMKPPPSLGRWRWETIHSCWNENWLLFCHISM